MIKRKVESLSYGKFMFCFKNNNYIEGEVFEWTLICMIIRNSRQIEQVRILHFSSFSFYWTDICRIGRHGILLIIDTHSSFNRTIQTSHRYRIIQTLQALLPTRANRSLLQPAPPQEL
jgi:hypothetical protein